MFRRDRSPPLGRGPRPLLEAAHHAVRLGGLGRRGLDFVLLPDDGGALPAAHRRDRGRGPGRANGLRLDGLQMEMARVEVTWFILKTEQLDAPLPHHQIGEEVFLNCSLPYLWREVSTGNLI